jgi:hypothetical protein
VHGIRGPAVWPPNRRPQGDELDQRACSDGHGLLPGASAQDHASGIAEMTEHLVGSESAPTPPTLGP